VHKTIGINKRGWDTLKSEFGLEIEREHIRDIHYLGKKMHVLRIGCLCDDNPTTFTAKDQAKRFFDTGWKRLRATVQAKEFLSKTSLDLAIIMVKRQKELDEKERKKEGEGNISIDEARAKSAEGDLHSLEEQEQLEEDEGELETIENEIFDYEEIILPYARIDYAQKKKDFETLWKQKGRKEYEVRNHIENEIFQKYKMRTLES
jgi:hypothetical protein